MRLEPLPAKRVRSGKAVRFTCSLNEGEAVAFSWGRNGVILKTQDRIDISTTLHSSTLIIKDVRASDSGDYVCVGRNPVSEDKVVAELRVEGMDT